MSEKCLSFRKLIWIIALSLTLCSCKGAEVPSEALPFVEPIPEEEKGDIADNSALFESKEETASEEREEIYDAGTLDESEKSVDEPSAEAFFEMEEAIEKSDAGDIIKYDEQEMKLLNQTQSGLYHHDQLNEDEQLVYVQILKATENYDENVHVSTLDDGMVKRVFQCVMNDHPEIFYVHGFAFTKYMVDHKLTELAFSPTSTISKAERDGRMPRIEAAVEKAMAGISPAMDDYEKIKYLYTYIVKNTEYDGHVTDNQNICSVFLKGRSVCQGYAKALQYLLNKAGVSATLILGSVSGGQGHAWNMVKSDGKYYYVDATWGDSSYRLVNHMDDDPAVPDINYDYLCVTTDELCKTHQINSVVKLPVCNSYDDNYYNREGALFDGAERDKLEAFFAKAYEENETYVTLKARDHISYDELYRYLIGEQHIFDYLNRQTGTVKYVFNDEARTMSFWL